MNAELTEAEKPALAVFRGGPHADTLKRVRFMDKTRRFREAKGFSIYRLRRTYSVGLLVYDYDRTKN